MGKEQKNDSISKEDCDKMLKDLKNSLHTQEEILSKRDEELTALEKEINIKEIKLKKIVIQAKNGFPQLFHEQFAESIKQLEKREESCTQEWQKIENKKQKLRDREQNIEKSELIRDQGFIDEREKFEQELKDKRSSQLKALSEEIARERASQLKSIEEELVRAKEEHNKKINLENEAIEKTKLTYHQKELKLKDSEDDLQYREQRLQSQENRLQERLDNIDQEVEEKVRLRKESLEQEKQSLLEEIQQLRDSISTSSSLLATFEELKRKLGNEDPETILLKLNTYEERIKNLEQELIDRPTKEMQLEFDRLNKEKEDIDATCERLSEQNSLLAETARNSEHLEMEIMSLTNKNKTLEVSYESIESDNNRLYDELKRLQSAYEREADREARIRDIEDPYMESQPKIRTEQDIDEIEWLDGISQSIEDYGFKFPRRILHAFHTSLKTSEWSPLTVLAGVSGTGKSELPRLYSHFGGINFLSLAVQPNWDSQESMLGFFNSIDNKFDAQPVLRFLTQSQKGLSNDYPGLEDTVNLILLDEMNLAHVELYFAEFLSKLELRRGTRKNIPTLDIKLGAGIAPYKLPLGRNVLWAGTMNQDETTKSLSDKVLDRGIVINFPRPTSFERRKKLKPLGDQALLLPRGAWQKWWKTKTSFEDNDLLPYKNFVEEMNNSLAKVGRALGHRVWQSIEYYMANYPDVICAQELGDEIELKHAMKTAFEDQLVQKVMPKLRGIETRGKSTTDCLDKIRFQLETGGYTIIDDFDHACEFGYGQFIWSSANYLNIDDTAEPELIESEQESQSKPSFKEENENIIPSEIVQYAQENDKELYQVVLKEIITLMKCSPKEAQAIKTELNKAKKD